MFDGIYGYFFGGEAAQPTASATNEKNASDWILVDQTSGRSSPVLVADLDMQELNDEDVNSIAGEKEQQLNRQRLRKLRKEIAANQTKKQQVREMIQRRQEVEKKLFEDSSGTESTASSPTASTPPMPKHIESAKPTVPRKKKCANIKQPKGSKGDNRANAK